MSGVEPITDVREHLLDWIREERSNYADGKYEEGGDIRYKLVLDMSDNGIDENSEWYVFISNYLRRAQLFGANTVKGRQALGKLIVTLMHALETSIVLNGPMPKPGVSSSEDIQEWKE